MESYRAVGLFVAALALTECQLLDERRVRMTGKEEKVHLIWPEETRL